MVSISELKTAFSIRPSTEYQCCANVNLYDSPHLERLATQAVAGRQLRILSLPLNEEGDPLGNAMQVRLCEDDYDAWMPLEDIDWLEIAESDYQAPLWSAAEISDRLQVAIAFALSAMKQPNRYLWGGTVGPDYDCSGLVQAAFAATGIWLPRDSYQQEAFTQPIGPEELQPGDLVFFGSPERTTHVGLYLGERYYIHSSGKDQGRNGIGIDQLAEQADPISQTYFRQFRRGGRVTSSYQPQKS